MEGRESNAAAVRRRIRDALTFRNDLDLCEEDEALPYEVSSFFILASFFQIPRCPKDIQYRRPAIRS